MYIPTMRVILLSETILNLTGLDQILDELGSEEFELDAPAFRGEGLVEVAGRLCYRSFEAGLNKNVTKVRQGNKKYIGNILESHHGSVLEHASVSIAFMNASRIFTHEIVRHRAGTAFSQESMRYVRLDNIGMYYPDAFKEDFLTRVAHELYPDKDQDWITKWAQTRAVDIRQLFERAVRQTETVLQDIELLTCIDRLKNFTLKKQLTSAMRRIAPSGHTTNIIVTANHRAWRHMISQRMNLSAEEEIRKIFLNVAEIMANEFPHIYQDMVIEGGVARFGNEKV